MPVVREELDRLKNDASSKGLLKQILKTLGFMETNLEHPSLRTHRFHGLTGPEGQKVFQCYAQNHAPGAYRVLFCYGPDRLEGEKTIPRLTVLAIGPHS